jgi:hypothetical protein
VKQGGLAVKLKRMHAKPGGKQGFEEFWRLSSPLTASWLVGSCLNL